MPSATQSYEQLIAALNGVIGDHLAASGNPLATPMQARHGGRPLTIEQASLRESISQPSPRLLVLFHGLCLSDSHWQRQGHDHGARLRDALGCTPIYLRYNSGLHISQNGRRAAQTIEELIEHWPVKVEEIALLTHSMGGLVARSACHFAQELQHRWIKRTRQLVFLGTPHHGAPLERGGHWLHTMIGRHPYTSAFAHLGRLRSAGITDLRRGCLRDEDWMRRDRFAHPLHPIEPTPLPKHIDCFAIAGLLRAPHKRIAHELLGDGLVPIDSAFGDHKAKHLSLGIDPARRLIAQGVGHMGLLARKEVYQQLEAWLGASPRTAKRRRTSLKQ